MRFRTFQLLFCTVVVVFPPGFPHDFNIINFPYLALKVFMGFSWRGKNTTFGASRGVCISQIFNSIHNFSQLFTTLFFFVGEAFKCRHLHFRNPSGQWWGQFAEMDKFSSFPHSAQYTGTQVHHITFYLVNPSMPLNGWVTTQPKKNPPPKKKSIHNFSQLFTIFHNFSPFFTSLHNFIAVFVL